MAIFLTGTGTNIGKTFTSLLIMGKYAKELGWKYCKPIQTGPEEDWDKNNIQTCTSLPDAYFLETLYSFSKPVSPHLASESENLHINRESVTKFLFTLKKEKVLIEGAGGLLVPINRETLTADVIAEVGLSVVVIGSTQLGTIHNCLSTIESARKRGIRVLGFYLVGEPTEILEDNIKTISEFSKTQSLGSFTFDKSNLPKAISEFDKEGIWKNLLIQSGTL